MQKSDLGSRAVGELFLQAATDPSRWIEALDTLAQATGSLRAQLIGVNAGGGLAFNFMTRSEEALARDFSLIDASHGPGTNYRVAASMHAAPGEIFHESHYDRVRQRIGYTAYEEACEKHGLPFGCQTALLQDEGALVGLALLRSRAEGPTTESQRRLFAAVAPQAQAAARLQARIEGSGAELVRGALDAVAVPALLIDGFGRVQATTPAADRLIAASRRLDVHSGAIAASSPTETKAIQAALRAVLSGSAPEAVVLLRGGREPPVRLEIQALPASEWDLGFRPRALIVLNGGKAGPGRLGQELQIAFCLTAAEADVAVRLAAGMPRPQIADERGTSIGTVRQQVKAIFAKLDVAREAEFLVLLTAFDRSKS